MRHLLAIGLLFFVFSTNQLLAQTGKKDFSLVVEGGGYSRFWALGVEKELWQQPRFGMGIRLGLGAQTGTVYLPGRLQFYSRGQKHRFQGSLGATVLVQRVLKNNTTDTHLLLGAGVGYRYQNPAWPLWLQLGFVQLLDTDPTADRLIDPDPVWRPALEASAGILLGRQ
jgi:hypothetical protein